jgi:D-threonate/D-erythronate kinase
MIKLVVISDDLTGALDTAVQFTQCGVKTTVLFRNELTIPDPLPDVLVINTESRHLPYDQAYERVFRLVNVWNERGVAGFYKKTDSVLRGNIGSEFAAILDATGAHRIYYFPAYPQNGRTTKNGIQYYNGIPISESELGKDLLSPLMSSNIELLLLSQMDPRITNVLTLGTEDAIPEAKVTLRREVLIFDAESDEEMSLRSKQLRYEKQLDIIAGCAGFARYLPDIFCLPKESTKQLRYTDGFLFVCGSLNPISKRQIQYAEEAGFIRIHLSPEQMLLPGYLATDDGRAFISALRIKCQTGTPVIVDVISDGGLDATQKYAVKISLKPEEISAQINMRIGELLNYWVAFGLDHTLMITGGDTLLSLIEHVPCSSMMPIQELSHGIVVSIVRVENRDIQVISKSGGFGTENDVVKVWQSIQACARPKEEKQK